MKIFVSLQLDVKADLKYKFILFFLKIRSNVEDKTNEIKDLKEQIRKLDEQLELEMQASPQSVCSARFQALAGHLSLEVCLCSGLLHSVESLGKVWNFMLVLPKSG